MVLCMLSLGTAPAFGHTRLLESVPPEGHVIPMGTRVVELRYSAPIQPRFSDFVLHFLGAPGGFGLRIRPRRIEGPRWFGWIEGHEPPYGGPIDGVYAWARDSH